MPGKIHQMSIEVEIGYKSNKIHIPILRNSVLCISKHPKLKSKHSSSKLPKVNDNSAQIFRSSLRRKYKDRQISSIQDKSIYKDNSDATNSLCDSINSQVSDNSILNSQSNKLNVIDRKKLSPSKQNIFINRNNDLSPSLPNLEKKRRKGSLIFESTLKNEIFNGNLGSDIAFDLRSLNSQRYQGNTISNPHHIGINNVSQSNYLATNTNLSPSSSIDKPYPKSLNIRNKFFRGSSKQNKNISCTSADSILHSRQVLENTQLNSNLKERKGDRMLSFSLQPNTAKKSSKSRTINTHFNESNYSRPSTGDAANYESLRPCSGFQRSSIFSTLKNGCQSMAQRRSIDHSLCPETDVVSNLTSRFANSQAKQKEENSKLYSNSRCNSSVHQSLSTKHLLAPPLPPCFNANNDVHSFVAKTECPPLLSSDSSINCTFIPNLIESSKLASQKISLGSNTANIPCQFSTTKIEQVSTPIELATQSNIMSKMNSANKNCSTNKTLIYQQMHSGYKPSSISSKQAILFGDMVENDMKSFRKSIESQQVELQRMQACLDKERRRTEEIRLNQELIDNDSNLHNIVSALRSQKLKLEQKNAMLEESLQTAHCSLEILRHQLHTNDEEWNTQRNDYRNALTVLEKELEQVIQEKAHAQMMWAQICDENKKMEASAEQRRVAYDTEINELRSKCQSLELGCVDLRENLQLERTQRQHETIEWQDFQRDLQTAVCVANDLKIEAEERAEHLEQEICRLKQVECTLSRDKGQKQASNSDLRSNLFQGKQQTLNSSASNLMTSEASTSYINYDLSKRVPIKDIIKRLEASMKPPKSDFPASKSKSASERKQVDRRVQKRHFSCKTSTFGNDDQSNCFESINRKSPDNSQQTSNTHGTTTDDVKFITRSQSLNRSYSSYKEDSPLSFDILPSSVNNSDALNWNQKSLNNNAYSMNQQMSDDKYNILSSLAMRYPHKGSRRNALLKWCRECTNAYREVDITNFSSSWTTGTALIALLHSFLPEKIQYAQLIEQNDQKLKFQTAFAVAEEQGISTTLDLNNILNNERPAWEPIMDYVTEIYRHFGHQSLSSLANGNTFSSNSVAPTVSMM